MKPQIDDKPTDDKKQVMTNPSCEEANDKNDRKKPVLTGTMTDGRKKPAMTRKFSDCSDPEALLNNKTRIKTSVVDEDVKGDKTVAVKDKLKVDKSEKKDKIKMIKMFERIISENKTKSQDSHYSLNSSVQPVLDGGAGECHGGAGQVRGEERVHSQLGDIFSYRGTSLLPTTAPKTMLADLPSKSNQTKFLNTTIRAEPDQSEWRKPAQLNSGTSSPCTVEESHLKRKVIKAFEKLSD